MLRALYVPDAGLVPRGRELRESDRRDQRRGEQSDRHSPLAWSEQPNLVRLHEHTAGDCEPRIGREQGQSLKAKASELLGDRSRQVPRAHGLADLFDGK